MGVRPKTAVTAVPLPGSDSIEEHKGQKGALMPVLQGAQEIYGYLPIEVQKMISLGLDIPLEEIYGVATFYSQFTLNPKGQYKISVCLGTACYVKGSGDIFQRLQEKLGIQSGMCTPDHPRQIPVTPCRSFR